MDTEPPSEPFLFVWSDYTAIHDNLFYLILFLAGSLISLGCFAFSGLSYDSPPSGRHPLFTWLAGSSAKRFSPNLFYASAGRIFLLAAFFLLFQFVVICTTQLTQTSFFTSAGSMAVVLVLWFLFAGLILLMEALAMRIKGQVPQTEFVILHKIMPWVIIPVLPLVLPAIWFHTLFSRRTSSSLEVFSLPSDEALVPDKHSADDTHRVSAFDEAKEQPDIRRFRDITARQIMCPRMDICAVSDGWTFEEVLSFIKETGYSRLPVYHEDLDTIKGILYVKDLLPHMMNAGKKNWRPWIREEILFVPESVKIHLLLRDFQTRRQHMAIIVDEYGGTSGIATLEDIMEELVGEIRDEFDAEEEQVFHKISETQYLFDGKTLLQDVCRIAGLSSSFFDVLRKEADSLGGLILEQSGNLPLPGKTFTFGNVVLSVMYVNKNRIERIGLEIQKDE